MDTKNKESKGTAATASKMAVNKKQGDESPTSNQDQNKQNQGGTGSQNQPGHEGQDLLQQAKQTTNEVVSQVQQQANSQINRQKESAASELSTVVNAVRRFGETLNNEGQGPIARFAAQYGDKAANSLDRAARYLREQDSKQLLNDVQNFGRRQPALLIGGAFLLGFAGARIIKSSMDAATSSMNTGAQNSMNKGAQQQSFNTNVSGAQQTAQRPVPPPPNPGL